MAKANEIKKELLKQMEKDSDSRLDTSAKSAWEIIGRHKAQFGKLKWITATSWLFTFIHAVGMYNLKIYFLERNIDDLLTEKEFWLIRHSGTTSIVLLAVCVLLTYLVYVKSKRLTMLQICGRLANIEEQLKNISQAKESEGTGHESVIS